MDKDDWMLRVYFAVQLYIRRQEGLERPDGTTYRVVGGFLVDLYRDPLPGEVLQWVPSDWEKRECCWPYWRNSVLRNHCKTQVHVAHLFNIPTWALRRELRYQLGKPVRRKDPFWDSDLVQSLLERYQGVRPSRKEMIEVVKHEIQIRRKTRLWSPEED